MSGGAFDYAQYRIDDVISRIEREIKSATCERTPLVTEHGVFIRQKIEEGHYRYPAWCNVYSSFETAEKSFKDIGCVELERFEEKGKRTLVVQDPVTGDVYEIKTYASQRHAPDENGEDPYYSDWNDSTLKEFRRGIDLLKRSSVYVKRIGCLINGEYDEDNFHERLKEDLKDLEEV